MIAVAVPSQPLIRDAWQRAAEDQHASLLQLLHPHGHAVRTRVFGSHCPASLLPPQSSQAQQRNDLIIIAPTVSECAALGWLADTVAIAADSLGDEGVVYALVTPPWRSYVVSLLRNHGLAVTQAMMHLPSQQSTHYMVPLQADALAYTFSHLIPTRRWRRRLVTLALRVPGAVGLVSNLIPAVGLLAQRRGAAPAFNWISERVGTTNAATIVTSSWRGYMGSVVLHHLDERQRWPTAVAKTTLHNKQPMLHIQEMANLQRIAHTAQVEQARIPKPVWLGMLGQRPVLVQSAVEGASLAHSLNARPERLNVMLMRIADWLEAWNRATVIPTRLTHQQLYEHVLQPAAALAAYLPEGRAYCRWLEQRTHALLDTTMPMVATHNDLTASNIMVNEQGRLRIVDWETARLRGLPLVDFWYAAVDAVVATGLAGNRVQAFKHCFHSQDPGAELIERLQKRLVDALQVPPACVELAFHACWLHHAANELQQPARSYQPFVDIVKHISINPAKWL